MTLYCTHPALPQLHHKNDIKLHYYKLQILGNGNLEACDTNWSV